MTTTMDSVERDEKGRVKGGALNPGGMTAEQKAFRALMQADLSTDEMRQTWKTAYRQAMADGNAPVLLDYANRMLGKPKERVELSGDEDNPVSPFSGLTLEHLQAVARAQLEKEKKP